ncbi:MAG: helix-hairpin-helix domain-containing protein [Actinomycetota bacterium]|nr:helix-hairpin-helix domain-containing protein [Actinomycetota bacterium]
MDDSLFVRGADEPDVERLFSEAVERQVTEQRELNRLLGDAAERLDGMEAVLRALRDSAASQAVALRSEVHEALGRLGEELDERFRRLAEEIDRLRQASTDHAVRLVQLAESTEGAVASLDERAARLDQDVQRLADQHATPDDDVAERVETALSDLGRVVRGTIEAVEQERNAEVVGQVRDVVALVSDRLAALEQQVQNASWRTGEAVTPEAAEHLQALVQAVESATDRTTALDRRVEALADEFREQAVSRRDEDAARREADARELLAQLGARVDAGIQDTVVALRTSLLSRLAALEEQVDNASWRTGEAVMAGVEERLAALVRPDDGDRLTSRLAQELDARVAALGERLAARVGDDRAEAVQYLQALVQAVESATDRTTTLDRRMEALADELDARFATQEAQLRAGRFAIEEHLTAAEERRVIADAATRAAVDEQLTTFVVRADQLTRGVQERTDELRAALEARLAEATRRSEDHLAQATRISEAQSAHLSRISEAMRTALDATLERVVADLDRRLQALDAGLDERLPQVLEGHRRQLADALTTALDRGEQQLRAAHQELRSVGAEVQELGAGLQERVEAAIEAAATDFRRGTQEATEAVRTIGDETAADVRAVGLQAAGNIRVASDEAAADVRSAGEHVQQLVDFVGRVEASLVEYLDARDRRLEQERHRVLQELVEEFAAGLSRRETRKLAGRLDAARERILGHEPPPDPEPRPVGGRALLDALEADPRDEATSTTWGQHERATSWTTGATDAAVDQSGPELTGTPPHAHPGDHGADQPSAARRESLPGRTPASHGGDNGARSNLQAVLADVKGLGPSRTQALLDRFGTLEAIRAASIEDLIEVKGIGVATAREIRRSVRPRGR